jgi:stress-induced morphogen
MCAVPGIGNLRLGGKPEEADMCSMQPDPPLTRAQRMEVLLTQALAPSLLRIVDDSASHAGHAGARPGGQTHYSVLVVSAAFEDHSRVARARAVHAALASEFDPGDAGAIHALALTLRTPKEQETV